MDLDKWRYLEILPNPLQVSLILKIETLDFCHLIIPHDLGVAITMV